MKANIYKTLIIGLLQILFISSGYGQEEFVKKEQKTFSVSKSDQLKVVNKYGDIEIRDWANDKVSIEAKIIIRGVSKERADEMFRYVKVELSQTNGIISAITQYQEEFFDMTGKNFADDNKKFEVKYLISLPAWLKVEAENKYGDVFISKLISASIIRVKYGTLKINQLLAENKETMAEVDLAYSKGSIEECGWLRIISSYSKLGIEESQALAIVSKYSKLSVEHVSSLVSESKYDTYEIGITSNFVIESHYSNIKIDELKKKLVLNTKYTDSRIGYIPPKFDEIVIDNSYGSIRLGIDPASSYYLDGSARYARISYSDGSESTIDRAQDNNEMHVKGLIGNDKETKAKVKIETNYGGVNIAP